MPSLTHLASVAFSMVGLLFAQAPAKRPLEVLRKLPHTGYSEGLDFHEGYLWHALPNEILKIDPKDGSIVARFPPSSPYNESLTWFRGKLVMASYHDDGLYEGVPGADGKLAFRRVGKTPEIHGWGITHDGKSVIVTGNYSSRLYYLDPKTYAVKRTLETPMADLEDLAWDGTGIWTSSFTQHRGSIFRINPADGKASALFELPNPDECPVVDGIAYDGKSLWITGKNCPSLFQVKLPAERAVSGK